MRVLIIEDDSPTAKTIELALKSEGFVCDTSNVGEDGLEIAKRYDYDLIVLDLMLPDIDDKIKGLGFGAFNFIIDIR